MRKAAGSERSAFPNHSPLATAAAFTTWTGSSGPENNGVANDQILMITTSKPKKIIQLLQKPGGLFGGSSPCSNASFPVRRDTEEVGERSIDTTLSNIYVSWWHQEILELYWNKQEFLVRKTVVLYSGSVSLSLLPCLTPFLGFGAVERFLGLLFDGSGNSFA